MGALSSYCITYGVRHSSAREPSDFLFFLPPHGSSADGTHSVIGNYKPTHFIFHELSRLARRAPHNFSCQEVPPKLLSARVVRHPISPLARIWSALIRNTAATNAALQEADKDWTLVDFEDVYGEKDLKIILGSYAEIPAGIRPLLQGHIIHWVLTQAAIWTKCEEFTCAVRFYWVSTEHPSLLFLYF